MTPQNDVERRQSFASELASRHPHLDANALVNSLCYGLTSLRTLLFTRVHDDVERNVGQDSMVIPFSLMKVAAKTRLEIDIFQVVVSAIEAESRRYVTDRAWYLDWLRRLRLEDEADSEAVLRRLNRYIELSSEERRVGFSRVLEKTFPEATRAPLVLYRLFPLGTGIATAIAFGDWAAANDLREQQKLWLPSITDCHECRGQVLDNGEQCATCSNPLWTYDWLNATN